MQQGHGAHFLDETAKNEGFNSLPRLHTESLHTMTRLFQTPPLAIVDLPADDAHHGGRRLAPRFIILHATGGTDSRAWLTTTSPRSNPVSIHRLIMKDGTTYKMVPDDEQAWHAGHGVIGPIRPNDAGLPNLNMCSLGIELENLNNGRDPYPEVQIAAAVAQCVEWIGVYGNLPILSHADVDTRKSDPKGLDMDAFRARVLLAAAEAARGMAR